jgi:hypothetical protein
MKNLADYMRSRGEEVNELVRGAEPSFTVVMLLLARRPHRNEHGVLHDALLGNVLFSRRLSCTGVSLYSTVLFRSGSFQPRHTCLISTRKIGDDTPHSSNPDRTNN